ncbi:isoprenylcysteine carboxyl methyltransferase family protein [Bacillus sp. 2205SS5-2]|uniref:isoprenylcysteine carboxyl methyltransferase family protein n=1 Tax=Bacillus sp. 2205SS5-2 TaxID=3109031 RepID=UPI0030072CF0
MFPILFVGIVVVQRLIELVIARNNEKWMKSQGAIEYGKGHYKFMVLIHSLFFVSLLIEFKWTGGKVHSLWLLFLILFLLAQIGRVWVLSSLGKYWNTKILVLPNADVVAKGPYKYMKHPNYVLVTIELIVIPIMFQAYWTLFFFGCLNQLILAVRIPEEEKALEEITDYKETHEHTYRFVPTVKKD